MIKIAICDDEKELLNLNKNKIQEILNKQKIIASIELYQNGEFMKNDMEEGKYFDLYLKTSFRKESNR